MKRKKATLKKVANKIARTKKKPVPWNLKTQVKGAIRRLSARTPQHRECMEKAIHPTKKGPRGGKQYICACCKNTFSGSVVQVDHIEEVVPVERSIDDMTWDEIIERMFCPADMLQVLCKPCHKVKTKEETRQRKIHRDARKKLAAEQEARKKLSEESVKPKLL